MNAHRGHARAPAILHVDTCRRCGSELVFDVWALMPRSSLRCGTCGLPASPPLLTYLAFPAGLMLAITPIRGLFTAAEDLFGKPMPALAYAGCFVVGLALSMLVPGLVIASAWWLRAALRRGSTIAHGRPRR